MNKNNLLLIAMLFLTTLGFSQVNTQNESSVGVCDGTAALANPANYTTWTWYDSDGTTVLGTDVNSISSLCNGLYTVEVTDTSTWTYSYMIGTDVDCSSFTTSVSSTDATDNLTCDGSALANASGGSAPYNYSWTNGQNTQQSDSLCIGTYYVLIQDSNGCLDTLEVQIDADSTVTDPCAGFDAFAQTSNNSLSSGCDGTAEIFVSGTDGSQQYFWSQGVYTNIASDLCEGTYTVNVVDTAGCEDLVTFYIGDDSIEDSLTNNIWINVNVTDENGSCDGAATANIFGGTAPFTYEWSTGETTMSIDGLCEGLHSVIVTDANGNSSSSSFYVSDASTVIDPTNYPDSTGVDTFFTDITIDCDIDYNDIQSTYISSFSQNGDSIEVIWWVIMNNGDTVEVTTNMNFSDNNQGIFTFVLSVFCPSKSVANSLKAYDNIYVGTAGITETTELEFGVYPNPAYDVISISGDFTNATLNMIDSRGRTVKNINNFNAGQSININDLDKGIYFVQAQSGNQTGTIKIVKR